MPPQPTLGSGALQPRRSAWKPWHKWLNNGGVRSIPMAPLSDLIDLLGAFDEESVEDLLVKN